MANTRIFTGKEKTGFAPRNSETNFKPNRVTNVFRPNKERMGTDRTANVLLLDESFSGSESIGNGDIRSKVDGMKESACTFIGGLPSNALVSVITFNDHARVICPMSQIGNNKLAMIKQIQRIQPSGSTNMIHAFELAEQELSKIPAGYTKRLYCETDGMPDEDPTQIANRIKASDVQITTIGFGESQMSLDEDLLRRIASTSANGKTLYFYISDAVNLTGFLKRESKTLTA